MYVKGYTNQPEFFQKFGPPVQLDLKERHRISVALPTADYLDDDHYSDTPIGVSMDDFTLRPIGPGVIMTPTKVIVTPASSSAEAPSERVLHIRRRKENGIAWQ